FMNNIKKESLNTSFYEEVVDLMIDSSLERDNNIVNISDVEEFQYDQVDPEFEELEAESLVEEPINNEELIDNDEEIPEIACFIFQFYIKTIIHSSIPVEYPATLPEGVATIFHIAD
ncbi:9567_t:CDS:2, partial [Gigaspora margarita]